MSDEHPKLVTPTGVTTNLTGPATTELREGASANMPSRSIMGAFGKYGFPGVVVFVLGAFLTIITGMVYTLQSNQTAYFNELQRMREADVKAFMQELKDLRDSQYKDYKAERDRADSQLDKLREKIWSRLGDILLDVKLVVMHLGLRRNGSPEMAPPPKKEM